MKLINLTPHDIVIVGVVKDGKKYGSMTIPACGNVARVTQSFFEDDMMEIDDVGDISTTLATFGTVNGLPPMEDGVVYIVSSLVASHPDVKNRSDVYFPAQPIRDSGGNVIGCTSLGRFAQ